MRAITFKLASLLAGAISLASIAGCSPEEAPLPGADKLVYNSELTSTFQDLLKLRNNDDRHLGLRRVVLSCDTVPGTVHLSVAFKDSSHNLPKPLVSDKPCSETGTLVVAESRETRGTYKGESRSFAVYAKQPYATAMVQSEWQKVLDAAMGTFALNKAAGDEISAAYAAKLRELRINRIRFACNTAAHVVTYTVSNQQSWHEGVTTVSCPPALSDKSELLATLEGEYSQETAELTNRYRVYAAQTVPSATLGTLVEQVLHAAQPRNSF